MLDVGDPAHFQDTVLTRMPFHRFPLSNPRRDTRVFPHLTTWQPL